VAENLVLGDPGSLWLARDELEARARELLTRYELELDPHRPAGELAVAEQQRLEIVRALARGVEILVLDEPTAVLAPSEVDDLLALLARLREQGKSVVFISHKLEEITQVCDRVTVLRDGRTAGTRSVAGVTAQELGQWMVGDALPPAGRPAETRAGEPALRMTGLVADGLSGIDLELRAGQVLAIAGIDGNGQGPLEEVLVGVRPVRVGSLEVLRPPLAVLSGDRQRTGLVLDLSVEENLILPDAARGGAPPVFRRGLVRVAEREARADAAIEQLDIRARPASLARELSGGNQQKLCFARAIGGQPGVLVAFNPTRGLDVGATAFVREELRQQARAGVAVLLVSTELDEVLELGQRIAVLFRGRLIDAGAGADRARLGLMMLGETPA
jgi:simple sugar transport system ATP-binding protein